MTIAAIQFTPQFANTDANVAYITSLITSTPADVLVFPELATSGYFFCSPHELDGIALEQNSQVLQQLMHVAELNKRIVIVGFPERLTDSVVYNSALIGGYGCAPVVYRKSHLFYREKDVFTPGDTGFFPVHLPHLDCTIGTMICYDWRFPESARTLALRGADVVAVPANLVTDLWPLVMPARAAENKVYVVVANRVGSEHNGTDCVTFNGRSTIYAYNGAILQSVPPEADATPHVIVANINPASTRNKSFNAMNNIFTDRRPELYE